MVPRGWIAVAAVTTVVVVSTAIVVSVVAVDEHGLSASPPTLTGSLTLRVARNTDPQVEQFLADVGRSEPGWTSDPGTFVEGTIHWRLSHSTSVDSCRVAVRALPYGTQWLGAITTGTPSNVAFSDDTALNKALRVTAPANSREAGSYQFGVTGTDGTTTYVIDFPDEYAARFDRNMVSASAVVECVNHDSLFNRTRNVAGPVIALPVALAS